MRECPYELYVAIYAAVRAGLAAHDTEILGRVSLYLRGRSGAPQLAMMLALIEANRGERPRTKEDVCHGVLCNDCIEPR